jgi:Rieske Fe-S protein
MFLSADSPTRSLRSHPLHDGGELLIVGGEGHKVGQGDEAGSYARLEEWARKHWDVVEVAHRWSSQDNMPADLLPYVGRLWPPSERILTATGFRKWGLAMGTTAAEMLADRVTGRESRWQPTFDSSRLNPTASAPDLAKENSNVGYRFFRDRLQRGSADGIAPGEGRVVGDGLGQTAVYRDDDGVLHAVSARCTHLGCILRFNDGERSWDCPCHGSRFGTDGEVLQGPAVAPLEKRPAPS